MRVFVPSLPHMEVTRESDFCAYTAKIRRWPRMLAPQGHEVVMLGSEGVCRDTWNACSEYVGLIDDDLRTRWFGASRWPEDQVWDGFDANAPWWTEWNAMCIAEIATRIEPGDGIGLIAGWCQKALVDAFPGHPHLEFGVGYPGIMPETFHAFESNAWRSFCTARAATDDVRWFDAVIPNAYGLDEFAAPREHDGYLLFVGRPTERKGLAVVRELAQRFPVKCAGQSDPGIPNAEYVGLVRGDEKAKLFAGAAALLAPTQYFPPFEGVSVEAQLSGVPAITTDQGCFVENVTGIGGWRCNTLREFVLACERAQDLGVAARRDIARRARTKWSLEAVAPLYDRWLQRIETVYSGAGWYEGT